MNAQCLQDPTELRVTVDSALAAVKSFVAEANKDHFTTHDIARFMGAKESHVRIAFSWLTRYRMVAIVPGVRSVRYTGTQGDKYSSNVYEMVSAPAPADFDFLNRVFCRGRP